MLVSGRRVPTGKARPRLPRGAWRRGACICAVGCLRSPGGATAFAAERCRGRVGPLHYREWGGCVSRGRRGGQRRRQRLLRKGAVAGWGRCTTASGAAASHAADAVARGRDSVCCGKVPWPGGAAALPRNGAAASHAADAMARGGAYPPRGTVAGRMARRSALGLQRGRRDARGLCTPGRQRMIRPPSWLACRRRPRTRPVPSQ